VVWGGRQSRPPRGRGIWLLEDGWSATRRLDGHRQRRECWSRISQGREVPLCRWLTVWRFAKAQGSWVVCLYNCARICGGNRSIQGREDKSQELDFLRTGKASSRRQPGLVPDQIRCSRGPKREQHMRSRELPKGQTTTSLTQVYLTQFKRHGQFFQLFSHE
jgi:hypothetical protein